MPSPARPIRASLRSCQSTRPPQPLFPPPAPPPQSFPASTRLSSKRPPPRALSLARADQIRAATPFVRKNPAPRRSLARRALVPPHAPRESLRAPGIRHTPPANPGTSHRAPAPVSPPNRGIAAPTRTAHRSSYAVRSKGQNAPGARLQPFRASAGFRSRPPDPSRRSPKNASSLGHAVLIVNRARRCYLIPPMSSLLFDPCPLAADRCLESAS